MDLADAPRIGAAMMERAPLTGFIGLSHLGIVTSIGWASFGRPVLGYDPASDVVETLSRGELPIHEPGLSELLQGSRQFVTFTSDPSRLAECSMVVVSRDVPTSRTNESDLQPVLDLIDAAIPHLRPDVILLVMSQVPPGFTRALSNRIAVARPELGFQLFYWVETLIFGAAVSRTLEPERFIVGCAEPGAPLPDMLATALQAYRCPILQMSYESAELTKTAINLYLIGAVTYANTLSDLCEAIGADWSQIVPALRLDQRIGPRAYIQPGLGIAGGNLERDLVTLHSLCSQYAVDTTYLDALIEHNASRFEWVRRQLREHVFGVVPQPQLGIWGLTYKKNTHSTKNSPALRLLDELAGKAQVRAWDPAIGSNDLDTWAEVVPSAEAALQHADGLVILADWDEFARVDGRMVRQAMRRPVVIDCPGVLAPRRSEMESLGVEYVTMGARAWDGRHS